MFQNQEGLNRSTVCVLESQPELQRGDVRTGSCRLHHPGQQRPSHCGVWHSEGIGYGSLPSWSDLQALETRWGTGNKITRIHFKLQTDQKYTSVCSFFFPPKMKCVCVSNAQSELSDSVSVSSCHSFSIRWWAPKCFALPTTLATLWPLTSSRHRQRMTTGRLSHGTDLAALLVGWLSRFKNKLILGLILSFAFLGLFSCN